MKKNCLKTLASIVTIVLLAALLPVMVMADTESVHPGVVYRTQDEIRQFIKEHPAPIISNTYSENPSTVMPYAPGKLSEETETYAFNALNQMRFIAGLAADVERDETDSQKAQAASLVNAVNGQMTHYPAQPEGMDDALYELGSSGASSSNIARGTSSLVHSVHLWMEDSDSSNIDRLGHRRWLLNPAMQKTGFGAVGVHSAVYAFDRSRSQSTETGVAWPAQNMPVEYFGSEYAWNVSFGKAVNSDAAEVSLKRSDGAEWHFSKNSVAEEDYFNVENSGYGQIGCVIFRPSNVQYKAGDRFDVTITGVYDKPFTYSVDFFSICGENHQYSSKKMSDPSCTEEGVIRKVCDNCADVKYESIPAFGHDYSELSRNDGILTMRCENCNEEKTGSYPVLFTAFWKKSTDTGYYWSYLPEGLKPGDTVKSLVKITSHAAEANDNFDEMVYESSDPTNCVIKNTDITFNKPGSYTVTVYAKYNKEATKQSFLFNIEGRPFDILSLPTAAVTAYRPGLTLEDVTLSGGTASVAGTWEWVSPATKISVPGGTFKCRFVPEDSETYAAVETDVPVTVNKATPCITSILAGETVYGQTLADVELTGKACVASDNDTEVPGTFSWKDSSLQPKVSDSATTEYEVKFTPEDKANYNEAVTTVTITVKKADHPEQMPPTEINVANSCETVTNAILTNLGLNHWAVAEADQQKPLVVGESCEITALYIGADKDNFETVSAAITITRSSCMHNGGTTVRNAVAPDCLNGGNTGDTYCNLCGELIIPGVSIKALGHKEVIDPAEDPSCTEAGKTAGSHCSVCGEIIQAQSMVDALGHTEVADAAVPATCTKAGKTEGSHCSVCGEIIQAQKTVKALGHKWNNGKVTKAATALAKGIKTSTCTRCKETKNETINKLTPTIKLSATKKKIKVKKAFVLTISKLAKGDSVKTVKSNKTKIAKVKKTKTNKYKVTGVKKGQAVITVKLKSGKSAKCIVTVK